jgi:hypothetical protein
MSIFDFMRRGKGMKKRPLPPIRTIRPPGEARAKRQAALVKDIEESGIFEREKQREDAFMDTGSLELQGETGEIDNPYETHSWEMDQDEGLRRVEDQSMVNRKKPEGDADSPYDTIIKKKGW